MRHLILFALQACILLCFVCGCSSSPSKTFDAFKSSILKKDYVAAWGLVSVKGQNNLRARNISNAEDFQKYVESLLENKDYYSEFTSSTLSDTKISGSDGIFVIQFESGEPKIMHTEKIYITREGRFLRNWKISL